MHTPYQQAIVTVLHAIVILFAAIFQAYFTSEREKIYIA